MRIGRVIWISGDTKFTYLSTNYIFRLSNKSGRSFIDSISSTRSWLAKKWSKANVKSPSNEKKKTKSRSFKISRNKESHDVSHQLLTSGTNGDDSKLAASINYENAENNDHFRRSMSLMDNNISIR